MMVKRIPLDNVCEKKVATLSTLYDGLIDYVDISSVDNVSKRIVGFQTLSAKDAPSRAKQLLEVGDILVSTVRPNLNAVAMVEKKEDNLLVGSTGYCVLRCKDAADRRFIFHFCQSPYFVDDMTAQATGASYPAVTSGIVKNACVPAYPIEGQRQIAEKLDKLSELITLRKEQLAKLDELVKARFVEMFGDLADPMCSWNVMKLVDTCAKTDDIKCGPFGTQLSKDEYQSEGVAVWEIPQINSHFNTKPTHYLSVDKACQLEAYSIIPGDIAMSRKGNVGKCAVFPSDFENGIIHSDVLRIRVDSIKAHPVFIMYQLHYSRSVQHQIDLVSSGAIMAGINVTKLKQIQIHLPPLELQEKFASFVEQTNKTKLTIQASLDKLEVMKKALMQEYFG